MPSYNENDGGIPSVRIPGCSARYFAREWGFKGITVSDYMAVDQLASLQHVAPDLAAAGALALKSGVDMELPNPAGYADLPTKLAGEPYRRLTSTRPLLAC